MNYQQTLDFLFSQLPMYQRDGKVAYKANLNNTLALDSYFKQPHRKFKSIHVAGTNGKGSVSHMIASVLQETGLKTGLYTSPHLIDFRERIKINGQMIPETEVVDFVATHQSFIKELKPSFFELTVAMAFDHFARHQVDVAVIEVGMGGRLDSTNIILPMLSIITNIGYDHMQFLGNTLADIANEKAGIIKRHVPVIVGEIHPETINVFEEKAHENESPICFAERRFTIRNHYYSGNYQYLNIKNEQSGTTYELELDLLGIYQKKNILTVMASMQLLIPQLNIAKSALVSGLSKVVQNTGLQGRWQVIQSNPKIVCDTGHNAEGIRLVMNQIESEPYNQLHVVFGLVNDKDSHAVLSLLPKKARYYFTKASIPRALSELELAREANKFLLHGDSFPEVRAAFSSALKNANSDDIIYIGGSTFVVADFLSNCTIDGKLPSGDI